MVATYDANNIWWSYNMMITYYDDHTWWSYMMIISDDHIWCSYMMSRCDDHISYDDPLGVIIWESSGGHLEDIWQSFGIHLGAIWMPFGSHLGSMWIHLGWWRLGRHLEVGSQITSLPLQHNAKVPLTFQFHDRFLRVSSITTAYLQQRLVPTCMGGRFVR